MNNVENEVITFAFDAMETEFPEIALYSDYPEQAAKFPCCFLYALDSFEVQALIDSSGRERYTKWVFEASVFTNDANGRKGKANRIMDTLCEAMRTLGFRRTMRNPIPNGYDNSIYRIVARFEGIVSETGTVYLE